VVSNYHFISSSSGILSLTEFTDLHRFLSCLTLMSRQSTAPSSRSNSIPLADRTISHFTSGLPRRSRRLQSGTPRTPVRPRSSPLPVEPSEFHGVDLSTVPHVDNDPDWVDAPIPVPTPVFQTLSVADHDPINNQLAKAL